MTQLFALATSIVRRTDGQDLLEYALLTGLIALVTVLSVTTLGNVISNVFWTPIAAGI
jgi:Flp pilus assembly pilin Flp